MIPARQHVTTMYSGACRRWQLAMPPQHTPCCLDLPAARTNSPEIALPWPSCRTTWGCCSLSSSMWFSHWNRYNPSFSSSSDSSADMCVMICSSPCMHYWFLISWCVNSLGRVVVLCGCFCLADKRKYSALFFCVNFATCA
jgi:hypothetical protein